jgi:hypothetical protein
MYAWQDWALAAGIVVFALLAGFEATAIGNGFTGAIVGAALAAVCAYLFGTRAPIRRQTGSGAD